METKKKNKLLKIAVGKLQSELDKLITSQDQKAKIDSEIQKSQVFLTDLMQLANESKKTSPRLLNQSSNGHPLDISTHL
jgi:hypothetical protein